MAKRLMTSGEITTKLQSVLGDDASIGRIQWILRTRRHIEPALIAGGRTKLYHPSAVAMVRKELKAINATKKKGAGVGK